MPGIPIDRVLGRRASARARARARELHTATQRERLVERISIAEETKVRIIASAPWFPGTPALIAQINQEIRDLEDERDAVEALRES